VEAEEVLEAEDMQQDFVVNVNVNGTTKSRSLQNQNPDQAED